MKLFGLLKMLINRIDLLSNFLLQFYFAFQNDYDEGSIKVYIKKEADLFLI